MHISNKVLYYITWTVHGIISQGILWYLDSPRKSYVSFAWHIVSYGTWTVHSMYSMEYRNIPGSPMYPTVLGLPVHGHGVSQEVLRLAGDIYDALGLIHSVLWYLDSLWGIPVSPVYLRLAM